MDILDKDWLFSEPIDYEYKKYKLLSAINKYGSLIKEDNLYSVLLEIENRLEEIYKYKYEKNVLDDRMKILKGIDIENMSLLYEYPENSEYLQTIEILADESVEMLEKLYKFLREKWRLNEKVIYITPIPKKNLVWKKGILFLIDYNKNVITYHFSKPTNLQENWKKFELEFQHEEMYDLEKLSSYVTTMSVLEPNTQCVRIDSKKEMPFDECLLPISKYSLFNAIKKGDI
jgi:hypothetical protein